MARDRTTTWVRVGSFVLHGAAFAAIAAVSTGHVPRPIAIMVAEMSPEPEVEPPETPPPPAEAPEAPAPRRTPRPARSAPTAAADAPPSDGSSEPAPDYGVALAGVSSGPGGIAVPIGDPGGTRGGSSSTRATTRTLVQEEPVVPGRRRCTEDPTAPRQRSMPRVSYTAEALEAGVEGRVRIAVELDEEGRVVDAHVLSPLGHGLDEAALSAVRDARFEPATRCDRPIATQFVLGIRFQR